MMYQIYGNAQEVAICLGSHKQDSEWLMVMLAVLRPLLYNLRDQCQVDFPGVQRASIDNEIMQSVLWEHVFDAFPRQLNYRLMLALVHLAMRPYWHRIWIVQELAAAKPEAQSLCGHDQIGTSTVYMLALAFDIVPEKHLKIAQPGLTGGDICYTLSCMNRREDLLKPLTETLNMHSEMFCADVRDRLFGSLRFVDWEGSRLKPIVPDYSLSPWSIATTLVETMHLDEVYVAVRAMGIGGTHEEMQQALERQRYQPLDIGVHGPPITAMARIASSPERHPCDRLGTLSPVTSLEPCHTIRLTAMLCPEAKQNDIAIHIWSDLLLIVRRQPGNETLCDIIGQGLLVSQGQEKHRGWFWTDATFDGRGRGYDFLCADVSKRERISADVQINMTAEEALVFIGQDISGRMAALQSRGDARFRRLLTPPVAAPKGAVKLFERSR